MKLSQPENTKMSERKDIPHPSHGELFYPDAVPFNLAGELIDNSTTSEGEARVRALAESEARKAQQAFPSLLESAETERRNYSVQIAIGPERREGETLAEYLTRAL